MKGYGVRNVDGQLSVRRRVRREKSDEKEKWKNNPTSNSFASLFERARETLYKAGVFGSKGEVLLKGAEYKRWIVPSRGHTDIMILREVRPGRRTRRYWENAVRPTKMKEKDKNERSGVYQAGS